MAAARDGRVLQLRVFPDYGADPVWEDTGMADLDALPVSERLVTALRAWARAWEALVGWEVARYAVVDEVAHEAWPERGPRLADRLQRELGDGCAVEYVSFD